VTAETDLQENANGRQQDREDDADNVQDDDSLKDAREPGRMAAYLQATEAKLFARHASYGDEGSGRPWRGTSRIRRLAGRLL
jgi:hypothetical protein